MTPTVGERWHIEQQHRLTQEQSARLQAAQAQTRRNALIRASQTHQVSEGGTQMGYTEDRSRVGNLTMTNEQMAVCYDLPGSYGDAASLVLEVVTTQVDYVGRPQSEENDGPNKGTLWCWLTGAMSNSDRWFHIPELSGNWWLVANDNGQMLGQYGAPLLPKLRLMFAIKPGRSDARSPNRIGTAADVEVCSGVVRY